MKTGDLVCWVYEPNVPLIYMSSFRTTTNRWFAIVVHADGRVVKYWLSELGVVA
jgi:hypothetical protein